MKILELLLMGDIKIHKKIDIKNPIMIAAWPGMGNVAFGAVEFLGETLKAKVFAEIDLGQYVMPEVVRIKDGIADLPIMPKGIFYYVEKASLIIFVCPVQLDGIPASRVISSFLDFAKKLNVKQIYTGAAFSMSISYVESSIVYGAVNNPSLRSFLKKLGVRLMPEGHISGMNGTLIGFAKERGIDGICLLATMPVYAIGFPNPKASKALVEIFEKILNIGIDKSALDNAINQVEERMELIENQIKELFPAIITEEEKQTINLDEDKVPNYIMEKIERLFQEAKQDRTKIKLLKEELDRWNLYKLYEDRFLDLFKSNL